MRAPQGGMGGDPVLARTDVKVVGGVVVEDACSEVEKWPRNPGCKDEQCNAPRRQRGCCVWGQTSERREGARGAASRLGESRSAPPTELKKKARTTLTSSMALSTRPWALVSGLGWRVVRVSGAPDRAAGVPHHSETMLRLTKLAEAKAVRARKQASPMMATAQTAMWPPP